MAKTPAYKVLLVEDNLLARKGALYALERCGCSVDVVQTGNDALSAIRTGVYDLVLMDLGLPDRDGLTITETIRLESTDPVVRDVPIIAVTAHSEALLAEQSKEVGTTEFCVKPVTTAAVNRWLKSYVCRDETQEITA